MQVEPEINCGAGASAIIFHSLVNPQYPRQLFPGGVCLFSSEKVRISIRAAEGLPSSPGSRTHWPTCVDVWGPALHVPGSHQPPAASGSSAQTAGASALSAGFHPLARTRCSICMLSARQSSGDNSCPSSTPTRPPPADAGQPLRWPDSCACVVPVR